MKSHHYYAGMISLFLGAMVLLWMTGQLNHFFTPDETEQELQEEENPYRG